jgi:hypothetical protein
MTDATVEQHLAFLCETAQCKLVARALAAAATKVTAKGKTLHISFGPEYRLELSPPFRGKLQRGVPRSLKKVVAHHNGIALHGPDTPIAFHGVTKGGALASGGWLASDGRQAAPIDWHEDFVLFHPERRAPSGEPLLCPWLHDGGMGKPYPSRLAIGGVLLRLFASEVLGSDFFKSVKTTPRAAAPTSQPKQLVLERREHRVHQGKQRLEDGYRIGLVHAASQLWTASNDGSTLLHWNLDDTRAKWVEWPTPAGELRLPIVTERHLIVASAVKITYELLVLDRATGAVVGRAPLPDRGYRAGCAGDGFAIAVMDDVGHYYDMSDPARPHAVASFDATEIRGLALLPGGERMCALTEQELRVYALGTAGKPRCIARVAHGTDHAYHTRLQLFGDVAYATGWLVDLTEPTKPRSLANIEIGGHRSPQCAARVGDAIYVFSEHGHYVVVDVRDRKRAAIVAQGELRDRKGELVAITAEHGAVFTGDRIALLTGRDFCLFRLVDA